MHYSEPCGRIAGECGTTRYLDVNLHNTAGLVLIKEDVEAVAVSCSNRLQYFQFTASSFAFISRVKQGVLQGQSAGDYFAISERMG